MLLVNNSDDDPTTHLLEDKSGARETETNGLSAVGRRRQRRIAFVLSVACVVITAVLTVITLVITLSGAHSGGNGGQPSNCITPDVCNSNILNYIDDSFDPCDDFYSYSCGKWLSANPLNGNIQRGTLVELTVNNYKHLSEYLAKPVQDSDPDAIKKSKYIYSACTDVQFIQSNIAQHLRDFIINSGGWGDIGLFPDDGWDINYDLTNDHSLGSAAFFTWKIFPNDLNSSKPIIRVTQGGLSLPSPQMYYNSTGEDILGLVNTIKRILDIVSMNTSANDTLSLAKEIASYERILAKVSLTHTQLRNVSALYNPMTLLEFSDLFNLNWVDYLSEISNHLGFELDFTENTTVVVDTPEYFRMINEFVFNDSYNYQNSIVNYAKWQLLYAEYSQFPMLLLDDEMKQIYRTDLTQTTSQACAQVVEKFMPFAVARPFVKEFITEQIVDRVNETLNNILVAFNERITGNDWLDNDSKDSCKEKVNDISTRIAYPNFIKSDSKLDEYYEKFVINSSYNYFEVVTVFKVFKYFHYLSAYMTGLVDKTVWTEPPTIVNAYYISFFNQITILAGILREPAFAVNWPPFLLYGSIGTIISHEITHGFDDQGRQFDKDGNRIQWWTNESISQFNQRAQCFVEQYSNYSLQGYQVDGQFTLGENIADNGGIHTAYRAYKNVMNGATDDQQLIDGHTLDQLFFVAFAQLWCSKYSDAYLNILLQTDPHSPNPARVFGSLVNSKEFAAAFQCPKESRMNPINKCELW